MMKLIGEILNSSLTSRQVDSILVTGYWYSALKRIGHNRLDESRAIKWQNGVLTVNVCSSPVLMELQMKEVLLLAKFEEKFGEGLVKKIKYRVGQVSSKQ